MKILLTTHQFLPDHASGTEVLTFDTAKEFQNAGHDVSVFTGFPAKVELDDNSRFDSYEYEGLSVQRFHHAFVPMAGQTNVVELEYNNQLFASHFREYLLKEQPDIVQFFHLSRLSASAIDVCSELGIPMVMTPTDFWFVCPMSQLRMPDNSLCAGSYHNEANCLKHYVHLTQSPEISNKIDKLPQWFLQMMILCIKNGLFAKKWFSPYVKALSQRPSFLMSRMNKLDKVVFPTQLMGKILKDNGLSPQIMTYSPFGINLKNIDRAPGKGSGEKLRLGFMGTLAEHKGAHVLIEAIRSLDSYKNIELKIYGNLADFPDYVSSLKKVVGADDRVNFCGTFPNAEIGAVFSGLDVLVVPSIWYENTPLVIYSAQAAGCPVIASNLGGMSEVVVHGENGLLFEPRDAAGLADLIRQLCEDRALLGTLSDNAKQPKPVDEYAQELLTIYEEVFEEKRQSR